MSDWKTNRRAAGKAAGEARWNAQVDLINLDETARQLGYALADKYGFGAGSEEGLLLAGYAVDAVEGYDLGEFSKDDMAKVNQIFDSMAKADVKNFKDALNNLKVQRAAAYEVYKPKAARQFSMQDFNKALGSIKKGLDRLGLTAGEAEDALDKIIDILDTYLD
jgi:hypothetical protein|nr:MAG TPA_asm: hypothetical protein [Caudoviricetes sp.]